MDLDWPAQLLEHPSAGEVFLNTKAAVAAAAAAAAATAASTRAAASLVPGGGGPGTSSALASPLLRSHSSRFTPPSRLFTSLFTGLTGTTTGVVGTVGSPAGPDHGAAPGAAGALGLHTHTPHVLLGSGATTATLPPSRAASRPHLSQCHATSGNDRSTADSLRLGLVPVGVPSVYDMSSVYGTAHALPLLPNIGEDASQPHAQGGRDRGLGLLQQEDAEQEAGPGSGAARSGYGAGGWSGSSTGGAGGGGHQPPRRGFGDRAVSRTMSLSTSASTSTSIPSSRQLTVSRSLSVSVAQGARRVPSAHGLPRPVPLPLPLQQLEAGGGSSNPGSALAAAGPPSPFSSRATMGPASGKHLLPYSLVPQPGPDGPEDDGDVKLAERAPSARLVLPHYPSQPQHLRPSSVSYRRRSAVQVSYSGASPQGDAGWAGFDTGGAGSGLPVPAGGHDLTFAPIPQQQPLPLPTGNRMPSTGNVSRTISRFALAHGGGGGGSPNIRTRAAPSPSQLLPHGGTPLFASAVAPGAAPGPTHGSGAGHHGPGPDGGQVGGAARAADPQQRHGRSTRRRRQSATLVGRDGSFSDAGSFSAVVVAALTETDSPFAAPRSPGRHLVAASAAAPAGAAAGAGVSTAERDGAAEALLATSEGTGEADPPAVRSGCRWPVVGGGAGQGEAAGAAAEPLHRLTARSLSVGGWPARVRICQASTAGGGAGGGEQLDGGGGGRRTSAGRLHAATRRISSGYDDDGAGGGLRDTAHVQLKSVRKKSQAGDGQVRQLTVGQEGAGAGEGPGPHPPLTLCGMRQDSATAADAIGAVAAWQQLGDAAAHGEVLGDEVLGSEKGRGGAAAVEGRVEAPVESVALSPRGPQCGLAFGRSASGALGSPGGGVLSGLQQSLRAVSRRFSETTSRGRMGRLGGGGSGGSDATSVLGPAGPRLCGANHRWASGTAPGAPGDLQLSAVLQPQAVQHPHHLMYGSVGGVPQDSAAGDAAEEVTVHGGGASAPLPHDSGENAVGPLAPASLRGPPGSLLGVAGQLQQQGGRAERPAVQQGRSSRWGFWKPNAKVRQMLTLGNHLTAWPCERAILWWRLTHIKRMQ